MMTDVSTAFSQRIGWTKGERTGRYAMIIDHGKVVYAENEPGGDVTVSQKTFPSNTAIQRLIAENRFPEQRLSWPSSKQHHTMRA